MTPKLNRQVRLKSRPNGIPKAENFAIVEAAIPELSDRQFLVCNDYLSVEPAMRGWVSATANYSPTIAIGEVMRSIVCGGDRRRLAASRLSRWHAGHGNARMAGIRGIGRRFHHAEGERDRFAVVAVARSPG
jgi:NADPH-dependent curcumin reductase CurA